ncbi:MAG: hypothetical protein OXL68_21440, partial [Paracoccaceae bacterium]|nr:hypothetical protein [Paracoccaceae bacterium]
MVSLIPLFLPARIRGVAWAIQTPRRLIRSGSWRTVKIRNSTGSAGCQWNANPTAGLWRFAFWSFVLQGLVPAVALRLLLVRSGSGLALKVRRVPVARLMFVAGAILAISFAGAVGSTAASALLLLTGVAFLWLFVARDFAASRQSRLLPGHATDLAHPVGSGIAMTFVISLCMMSFLRVRLDSVEPAVWPDTTRGGLRRRDGIAWLGCRSPGPFRTCSGVASYSSQSPPSSAA